MPLAARKPCNRVGCPALVPHGERFCAAHTRHYRREQTRARRQDPERRARLAFYSTTAWRRCRAAKLARDPVCEDCRREMATEVDHKVTIAAGGARLEDSNLQSLCKSCHSRKTALEGGRW